ncbi:MAG: uroporphyrinogen decarboxylase [Oligoflexia bacterium]|nr:uroporphyrinogen decarboxylase [Oligoflexia bacterium]
MNLFQKTLARQNDSRPPVWFMRQAGRYHSHYQKLKERYSFIELCRKPEVACEATMGPIRDFDFDAAILFSDLLFPLEAMGLGLTYDPGPKLDRRLDTLDDVRRLQGGAAMAEKLAFQGRAMELIRKELPASKGLLGFVGGPATLFCYATEGSHSGELKSALRGMRDGRFDAFYEKLADLLAENMAIQARAGADTIMIIDTSAGEFDPVTYAEIEVRALKDVIARFQVRCPGVPVSYYSKGTGPVHWKALEGLPLACVGFDWVEPIHSLLTSWGKRAAVQGNFDPHLLFLEPAELETRIRAFFADALAVPRDARRGWVCGLGHGVLPKTPEKSIRLFLRLQREIFGGAA